MANQSTRRGVEAGGAPSARRALYALGTELEQLLVHDIDRVVHTETKHVPAPRQLFYDLLRQDGRTPVTVAAVGAALSAIARTPAIADRVLVTITEHFGAWLLSHRDATPGCLTTHWASETEAQAEADVAQARALTALERRDLAAIEAAIDETTQHIAESQRLAARLIATRRAIVEARRESMRDSVRASLQVVRPQPLSPA